MDLFKIAARAATHLACTQCNGPMLYDDGRDSYGCSVCGHGLASIPAPSELKPRRRRAKKKVDPKIPIQIAAEQGQDEEEPEETEEEPAGFTQEETEDHSAILDPGPEFACQIDLSVSATFEGHASKDSLVKKLKVELQIALETAIAATARDMRLNPSDIMVKPIRLECAVVDQGEFNPDGE